MIKLRECTKFLEENAEGWRKRKLKEVERLKREEKEERLAIIKVKKKRYGIAKLNSEETKRIRMRSEDRILLAKAKENL